MAKRRTSQVQRRPRASEQAMTRRVGTARTARLDWRIVALGGAIVVAIAVVAIALLVSSGDKKFQGTLEPNGGGQHVAVGTYPNYNSTPATSGPHWNQPPIAPMNWGVYTKAVPEPAAVHNLEHGGIVIWYQASKLSADQVTTLTNFVNAQIRTSQFKFILSPWTGKDFGHPIAVTAWRYLLYLDSADTDSITAFVNLHYENSPEPQGGPAQPT
jgi:hypothetical protein